MSDGEEEEERPPPQIGMEELLDPDAIALMRRRKTRYYVVFDWGQALYARIAYEGMIAVGMVQLVRTPAGPRRMSLLLPEMQAAYCAIELGGGHLHLSRNVRRRARRGGRPLEASASRGPHSPVLACSPPSPTPSACSPRGPMKAAPGAVVSAARSTE